MDCSGFRSRVKMPWGLRTIGETPPEWKSVQLCSATDMAGNDFFESNPTNIRATLSDMPSQVRRLWDRAVGRQGDCSLQFRPPCGALEQLDPITLQKLSFCGTGYLLGRAERQFNAMISNKAIIFL